MKSPLQNLNVIELAAELVRLPGLNPMGRNVSGPEYGEAALAAHLADMLRAMGGEVRMIHTPGNRPVMTAWFDFGAERTILLDAHLDTVPADNMAIEPFAGNIANGRLYGRGAADVRGPMAAMICAIGSVLNGGAPARNVIFAAVCDEEYKFTGIRHLLAHRDEMLPRAPDMAVIAEPTRLHPVASHKGGARWRMTAFGRTAHSSTPEKGDNAIYRMADTVISLRDFARQLRSRPGHANLGAPSLSVGLISGGAAANIIPDRCEIEIDRRSIPGETVESAAKELEAIAAAHGCKLSEPIMSAPPFEADPAAVSQILETARELGLDPAPQYVNYCTHASFYAAANIPSVVCGPGDIAQAHTSDEYIETESLETAVGLYARLIERP